ncbi:MAG: class I SAM-dependent methyltransferase [Stellaceae bacterium]
MSELDMLIRRLMAQRASIERAGGLVAALDGPAILLGLGDGAALDHLYEIARNRGVVLFDKGPIADGAVRQATERVEGDPRETLPRSWERLKRSAALALINFPITDEARLAAEVAPLVAPMLRPGAVVVSEIAVELPGWERLPPPDGVREGRHHLYRAS